ncbi:hypothetical protein CNR22_21150 [Sphingobacteriaceae bacterium]|nr:hypothetical protein CNR22_21150 [Sphingobacteriaceae bacterium]
MKCVAKHILSFIFLFCAALNFYGQKYNFVNWTVEDGLIQSQASFICQDNYRQLWIGTEGGISRFDGKKFTAYTVQDGLVANHINSLLCDKNGNLWIGTNGGLSLYNGKQFTNIKGLNGLLYSISEIVQIENGDIYALNNFSLIKVKNLTAEKILVTGDSTERVTTVFKSPSGQIMVSVFKKGIYVFDKKWILVNDLGEKQAKLFIRSIYVTTHSDTLICTGIGLLKIKNKRIAPFTVGNNSAFELNVFSVTEDSKQNLWLATEKGCYRLEGAVLTHFDQKSGFTDNSVNHIYKDIENNLWFGTNGDGIYKFRENTFTYYDKSSGLVNTIVMGVTESRDKTIYAAGYGGGLYKIERNNDISAVIHNGKTVLDDSRINTLYADDENSVWIGTSNKGAYRYNKNDGLQKIEAKNNSEITLRGATVFLKDKTGNMLIGSNDGLYVRDKNETIYKVKNSPALITALKQFDNEHVILGSSNGIFLLDNTYTIKPFNEAVFGNASVLCLSKNGNNIWIGTTDKGVLNWNHTTNKIISYTTADGLPSNFIYSIDVSETQKAWIGTGFGISNLQFDNKGKILAIKNYGLSDGLLGMECNHNCLLKASDSSLWFGTTKGLFHFNPSTNIAEKNKPFVLLRSVKLFSSPITDTTLFKNSGTWFNIPQGLKLYSKQNHLTFELGSIYFTNPEDVFYKYKLDGIDKNFTTTNNPYIIYPALPPGKYTLRVTGLTKGGAVSVNEISYAFEIEKAFYQTRLFQLIVILLLLGTGALIAYVFTRGKQKRKQKAKEILEKIREEEFMKLRQRTAEDFHDEMGNSLTRISVLTDILKSKISGKEQDVSNLVMQIKENTRTLYNGSKDIIWSLNSQNDGLYEIVEHIKDIGNELFQETQVDFNFSHTIDPDTKLKLKLDYSRNLTMIFKEAYSNILKHSSADCVNVSISLTVYNDLEIFIRDSGTGFDKQLAVNGNGLKNMKNRADRMNGMMLTDSKAAKGTQLHFILKDIFT